MPGENLNPDSRNHTLLPLQHILQKVVFMSVLLWSHTPAHTHMHILGSGALTPLLPWVSSAGAVSEGDHSGLGGGSCPCRATSSQALLSEFNTFADWLWKGKKGLLTVGQRAVRGSKLLISHLNFSSCLQTKTLFIREEWRPCDRGSTFGN